MLAKLLPFGYCQLRMMAERRVQRGILHTLRGFVMLFGLFGAPSTFVYLMIGVLKAHANIDAYACTLPLDNSMPSA
jgi:hypothetical protein